MRVLNYINGSFCQAESGEEIPNKSPSTGLEYGSLPRSDHRDVDRAVEAAKAAQDGWRKLTHSARAKHLQTLANGIEARLQDFAQTESIDNGKPVHLARSLDIPRSISNFRFFAGAAEHFAGESHCDTKQVHVTKRDPLGVVACISPWNLPLYLLTWKIAPALAAGNTVVAKPSEITPATAFLLSQVMDDIGFPKGVLNILHGFGAEVGSPLVNHPDVKAVTFTGGTQTGKQIAVETAASLKKLSLELGGKNPFIVCADADLDKASDMAVKAAFSNQGQICLCGSRIILETSISESFKRLFVAKVKAITVGDPANDRSQLGALVSESQLQKVANYVDKAKQSGGDILTGGEPIHLPAPSENGWYYAPTVIAGLPHDHCVNQDEIFGPVVTLTEAAGEAELIRLANDTVYGLSASIWTNDIGKSMRMSDRIECGMIWVNNWMVRDLRTPFGGQKMSGIGREGGWEAMRFMTQAKNISISYEEADHD